MAVEGARLGLGGMALDGAHGPIDRARAVRLVQQALDTGVVLIDTADSSLRGTVRRVVGRAVASRRGDALIAVHSRPFDGGGDGGDVTAGAGPRTLVADCERALKQLGLDCIDVYVVHPGGPGAPIEEQIGELSGLVQAGKIHGVGVGVGIGGACPTQLARAHATHPIAVLAVEYSLWQRQAECELLPLARRLGIRLMACQPLGRGLLTGRITAATRLGARDPRRVDPRFSAEGLSAAQNSLRALEAIAADTHLGAGRLALAWLLSRGADVIPVPSTRDPVHLEMNLSTCDLRLEPETQHRLSAIFGRGGGDPL
ncbi:aldo/keto reductase [Streptomyces sp. yr375]|uniref:aldo/keto reductase n=1 Tax=Streptomyces sp. yr375 TaxID=1761906 RepID=UPI0015A63FE4|nr:aldo/keto reductase [Streptomyces sp. yr375]